jgi:hypothetical protein
MDLDLFSIDQDGVEGPGKKPSKWGVPPVILSRDGSSYLPKFLWQTGPQNDRIQMAGMVRKVNALPRIGFGA